MYGRDRNFLIDCVRGFSILVVLASHGGLMALPGQYALEIAPIIKGYYGVVIFFTISGFLITRNTLKRYGRPSRIDFGQFYAMRAARIIPCLLLFLGFMVFLFLTRVSGFVPPNHQLIWSAAYNALIFQYNSFYLTAGNTPGLYALAPLWSLSIEEVFYFAFPIACFLTRRTSVLVVLVLGLIAYGPLVRTDYVGLYSFWGNADLLSLGCLTALLEWHFSKYDLTNVAPFLCVIGSAIAVATLTGTSPTNPDHYWSPTLIGFGTALVLFGATHLPSVTPWRAAAPLTWLLSRFGRVSYEIYLFHVAWIILYTVALKWCFGPSWAAQMQSPVWGLCVTAIIIGVTLAFGTLISRLFTEPWNRRIRALYAHEAPMIERRHIDLVEPTPAMAAS